MNAATVFASLKPHSWSGRGVTWAGGLFVAVIVALAGYDIFRSHRDTVADTGRELDSQARVIAEQTARTMQAVDVVLRHIAQQLQSGALASLSRDDLHAYLKAQAVGLVQVDGLVVFEPDGSVRAVSLVAPAQQPYVNVSGDRIFQRLKAQRGSDLLIEGPMRSPGDGRWVFPIGRRLESPKGEFLGAVGARGHIDYFERFYEDLHLDAGTTLSLIQQDGTLIARHPHAAAALGRRFPAASEALLAHDAAAGPIRAVSPVDGVERFAAVRPVPDYPLFVVATRDTHSALAPWREQAVGTAVRTLALAILAAVLLTLLKRQLGKLVAARNSLETSRERFALAVAGSDDGIWDWDYRSGTAFASARAREIAGLPPGPEEQSIDAWFAELAERFHPEDGPRRAAAIEAHLSGASPTYEGEYRVRNADGGYRWIRIRGLCVRRGDEKPHRMAGSVSDIDARKRAEESLRQSEQRYALAMTGSSGGHWVWDVATDALFVSGTVNQLFGLPENTQATTRREYFGQVRLHPDDRALIERVERDVVSGSAERADFEYRIILRDGEVRWILTRAQCFRDAEGRPLQVAGVSVDVSERKRTEESLRLSEERYALAMTGSNEGHWVWELGRDELFVSPTMNEIFGMPPDTRICNWSGYFDRVPMHPDDLAGVRRAFREHIASRSERLDIEHRIMLPDGSVRWIHSRGQCFRDEHGKALRMAGATVDVSDRKRAEEAMRQSEERYALAMAGSNEAHWVWDIARDELYASAKLNELFGLGTGAVVAKYSEYFARIPTHPEDAERVRAVRDDHVAGKTPRLDVEYRIVDRTSGEVRWIHTRGQCFCGPDGKPVRVAGSTIDVTDRKRTEQALRESEERFAVSVAGSNDGIVDWDIVNDRMYLSERAVQILGLNVAAGVRPRDEWRAMLRYHPDDVQRVEDDLRACLEGTADLRDGQYRVLLADGGTRWIRHRNQCVRDANGRPVRFSGSVSDIDAFKHAEEALRESEQRYALAIAGSNDGIIDWDIVNDRMFSSARALRILGIEGEPVVRPRAEWMAMIPIHPEDRDRHDHDLREHLEGRTPVREGEYRVRHRDFGYRWVRVRGLAVRDGHGHPYRMAGSVSDVDNQKRAEQALRQSDERYQLAVAGANQGLWDWDLASDLLFLSPRAQEMMGFTPGEPQRPRRDWIALCEYHPDDLAAVRKAMSDHLRGATAHFAVEYRQRHPSGQWHWYRERGLAVRDGNGRPYRMAGSLEDITESRAAEADRGRLEGKLRQAQKLEAIGTLAGGIAHDFNNILAAILGYGEMAQKDTAEGTPLRRHIDAAMSAGMRAKSLVERILAFSRSGMGERLPVNVQAVVAEALDLVAAGLPNGVRLERRLAAEDAAVLGDPTQVHQVVMNLCANAIQSMKASGAITVSLDVLEIGELVVATSALAGGRYVRLQVRDTGSGIAAHTLERIFDPFFTTKEVGVGTGLGLSLVHGIVTDLGGGIDVESRLGDGSVFTVYLPWQGGVAAAAPVAEAIAPGAGETILLVDDEETLVRLGEEMIAELGYEPVGFTSSAAALASFRAAPQRFNVVLSDEAMPEMTGSELARELRKIRPDIPIVLMSGYVTTSLSTRAREAGVVEVLSKPLVARDIARSLANALHS